MKEIWKPVNPHLDIEDCYEVSNLGRIKNIKYNKIQDDIHHSTNDFDYIFIATKDHKPSYQHIDEIVCATFCDENVNNVECGKPIIPYHKDGDTRNNRADNLEWIKDVEEWKPIVEYKDIVPDRYLISNHGRIYDKKLKYLKSISGNGKYYPCTRFMCIDNLSKKYDIHPIVATMFIPGYDDKHTIVNHIDNTYNNHWRNIEWCTFGWNNSHSKIINQCRYKTDVTLDQVDFIRDLLVEYKSPREVYKLIDHNVFPYVTIRIIGSIKEGLYNKSWKYTQKELNEFMNDNRVHQYYTTDDINHFCKVIKECNLDCDMAYNILTKEGYSILRCTLYSLKICKTHKEITEKYFK